LPSRVDFTIVLSTQIPKVQKDTNDQTRAGVSNSNSLKGMSMKKCVPCLAALYRGRLFKATYLVKYDAFSSFN